MKLKLIKSLAAFTLGLIGFDSAITAAAEYPNKPIRLLVGFPAGQMTDLLTRAVADELSKLLNNPIYVENKPGQGGSIALSQLARSTPDGYTLMLSPPAGLVINPNIYNSINYNTLEDFQPIAQVGEVPFVLIANNEMPFNTVQEFIDYAKERPGELAFISPGNGTLPHLGMVLFQKENNLSLVHVPYKGSPTAVADLA